MIYIFILILYIVTGITKKVKPGNHLEIPFVSVNCQLMLGTGYPLTSQSNTTGFSIEPAKFFGADLTMGAKT